MTFEVGQWVRDQWGRRAQIEKIALGKYTGQLIHSVKYPNDKGRGFYLAEELTPEKED